MPVAVAEVDRELDPVRVELEAERVDEARFCALIGLTPPKSW